MVIIIVFVAVAVAIAVLVVVVTGDVFSNCVDELESHRLKLGSRLSTGSPLGFSERLELGLRLGTRDSDAFGTNLLPHSNLLYRSGSSS